MNGRRLYITLILNGDVHNVSGTLCPPVPATHDPHLIQNDTIALSTNL